MKKITDIIIDSFGTKLRNPIILTYIFSWIIYNWKALSYYFISTDNISHKITTIEKEYTFSIWEPLIYAVSFVILIHLIMFFIEKIQFFPKHWREINKGNQELKKLKIKEKILLKKVNIDFIKNNPNEFIQLEKQNRKLTAELDKVKNLQKQNEGIIDDYNYSRDFIEYSSGKLIDDNLHFKLKKQYDKFKDTYLFNEFLKVLRKFEINKEKINGFNFSDVDIDKLKELEKEGIIILDLEQGVKYMVEVTEKGYFFYKEYLFRNIDKIKYYSKTKPNTV